MKKLLLIFVISQIFISCGNKTVKENDYDENGVGTFELSQKPIDAYNGKEIALVASIGWEISNADGGFTALSEKYPVNFNLPKDVFAAKYENKIREQHGGFVNIIDHKASYDSIFSQAKGLNLDFTTIYKDGILFNDFNYKMLNGSLPESYTNRKFIKNLTALTYEPFLIPGNIVKYDSGQKDYIIVSLKPFIKKDKQLKNELITSGLLYKDYLKKGMNLNGSYIIGSFEAKKEQIVEVNLTDISRAYIPDSLINVNSLKKVIKDKNLDSRTDLFFVKAATLTLATGSKFNESKFNKKINSVYITTSGEIYKTTESFKKERIVSLDLVALNDMIYE